MFLQGLHGHLSCHVDFRHNLQRRSIFLELLGTRYLLRIRGDNPSLLRYRIGDFLPGDYFNHSPGDSLYPLPNGGERLENKRQIRENCGARHRSLLFVLDTVQHHTHVSDNDENGFASFRIHFPNDIQSVIRKFFA